MMWPGQPNLFHTFSRKTMLPKSSTSARQSGGTTTVESICSAMAGPSKLIPAGNAERS